MTDSIPFNLNLHTARLLMREPFFAALSRRGQDSDLGATDRWRSRQPAHSAV